MRFEKRDFDTMVVPLGKMTRFDFGTKEAEFEKSTAVEGKVTRISYRVPDPERSSLEVFRNYETSLTDAGWEILWKASGKAQFGNPFSHLYESLRDNDQLFTYSDAQAHFLTAKKANVTALLFVTKYEYGLHRGIELQKGDPIIQLDVIEEKAMEQKMVLVTAGEMEKQIRASGKVALYGIHFDFNKSEIKPESEQAIVEIGRLLKDNQALRLLVVGHTDNAGSFEFNKDLSARRAAAVVEALTSRHEVPAARLMPVGVAFAAPLATNASEEGRALNRRVELVEY